MSFSSPKKWRTKRKKGMKEVKEKKKAPDAATRLGEPWRGETMWVKLGTRRFQGPGPSPAQKQGGWTVRGRTGAGLPTVATRGCHTPREAQLTKGALSRHQSIFIVSLMVSKSNERVF